MDTFDPKPRLSADARQARPAARAASPTSAPALGLPAARQVRHRGQRPVPARRRLHGRHLPHPLDADRPQRPLPGHPRHPHRLGLRRPPEHRLLGQLRPGDREPESALVRRPRPATALRRQPGLGLRLPARLPPGHPRPGRRRADPRPQPPGPLGPASSRLELALLDRFNRAPPARPPADPALAARIRSSRPPSACSRRCPRCSTCRKETDATLKLYGLERGSTKGFAWQCLVARRLVERGVRFVELIDVGSSNNWDAHGDMKTHEPLARNVDQPIAGLLRDLKSRGMLDDTLVVWTTEFGRTPHTDAPDGRGHHTTALFLLAGRRRRQGRHRLRQDRRLRREGRRGRGPRPRLPRHDPAPARLRPRRGSPTATPAATSA